MRAGVERSNWRLTVWCYSSCKEKCYKLAIRKIYRTNVPTNRDTDSSMLKIDYCPTKVFSEEQTRKNFHLVMKTRMKVLTECDWNWCTCLWNCMSENNFSGCEIASQWIINVNGPWQCNSAYRRNIMENFGICVRQIHVVKSVPFDIRRLLWNEKGK